MSQTLTSALRQTCAGCGDEIGACEPFVRDGRTDQWAAEGGEPWHPRCKAIADKWLADAVAEAKQLHAALAKPAVVLGECSLPESRVGEMVYYSPTTETPAMAEVQALKAALAKSAAIVQAAREWASWDGGDWKGQMQASEALLAAIEANP